MAHTHIYLARRWISLHSMLLKNIARTTSCSSGSPCRNRRLSISRSKEFLILAATHFSLQKRAASSGITRLYITSWRVRPWQAHNMDETSVASMSPCENTSEKISCLSALTLRSPKLQSCDLISWTRATDFSPKQALTTSYGASETGLRRLCTSTAAMARLKYAEEDSANRTTSLP